MLEREILQSLQQGITAAVAASIMPALPVKYVGRTMTPPIDQKWIELVYIPNNYTNTAWGNSVVYRGLFRLILHWPINDEGAYDPLDVVASIASFFNKDKAFGPVKVYELPDLTGIVEDGADRLFPLSISYRAFQTN